MQVFLDGELAGEWDVTSQAQDYFVYPVRFYTTDHLGATIMVTNAQGAILSDSDYYPYGAEVADVASDSNHYGFAGKERDSESDNDYFGARYYKASILRFMTPDWAATAQPIPYATLDNPQSMNLYSYVVNNPLRNIDTDGHSLHSFPVDPMDYDPFRNTAAAEEQELQREWDKKKEEQQRAHEQAAKAIAFVAVAGTPTSVFVGAFSMSREVTYNIFSLMSDGTLGPMAYGLINLKETILSKTEDSRPATCRPSCDEHSTSFDDDHGVGRGQFLVVKRIWTYQKKPAGVWVQIPGLLRYTRSSICITTSIKEPAGRLHDGVCSSMKTTKATLKRRSLLAALIMVCISLTSTSHGSWVCCEGDEWLSWDQPTREVYVRAYTLGNLQGYNRGCNDGVATSTVGMNGQSVIAALKRCAAKAPISSRDSAQFVTQITTFYQRYRRQRFLRISDILLGFYAGKNLEQIHLSFPQGD